MNAFAINLLASIPTLVGQPPTADPVIKTTYPLIAGKWRMESPNLRADCNEDLNFLPNNRLLVVSADEWTYGTYRIIEEPKLDLPILLLHTILDDNQMDCSGNQVDQAGENFASFMKQLTLDSIVLCSSVQGGNCPVKLNRILP